MRRNPAKGYSRRSALKVLGLGPSLRVPFGRVHWAGTETSPVWSGSIEGAIRSGERAAAEVVPVLG